MKLAEALSIVQKAPAHAPDFPVLLACGFTPLHLESYFVAHLQNKLPNRRIVVHTGVYGDLAGTVEQISESGVHAVALVVEWADLDPRLGYRHLGGWGQRVLASIVASVEASLERLEAGVRRVAPETKLAVSLPTLPLPPGFHTTQWQASKGELALEEAVARFAREIAAQSSVLLVNRQKLDTISPLDQRYDFRSDLHTGFPYTLGHADALGGALAALIESPPPKKGLITDLDDTLWAGLVGEVGHENVSWDLATNSQLHGLYQQMLHALADHGVLIGVASKNSPEAVDQALARSDLAIVRDKIFPIEVHWEPKSESVERILKTWNIGADSVVFVDDSPMELAEVGAAHPGIECLLFPKCDYARGLAFLRRLRDLFGKPLISEEDSYRTGSIRTFREVALTNGSRGLAEQFLATAEAKITLEYNPGPADRRVVELVNKTNQFNLNGERYTAADWHHALERPGVFALAVSYEDKHGPLGKIAVVRGRREDALLHIETWVMSCRAFSRRIEHQCLAQLFHKFAAEEMILDFKPTPKNKPIQAFLAELIDEPAEQEVHIRRSAFEAKCPKLYHMVVEKDG